MHALPPVRNADGRSPEGWSWGIGGRTVQVYFVEREKHCRHARNLDTEVVLCRSTKRQKPETANPNRLRPGKEKAKNAKDAKIRGPVNKYV